MGHLPIEQLVCWQRCAERTVPAGMEISLLGASDSGSVIVAHGIDEATDDPGILHAPHALPDLRLWRLVSQLFDETIGVPAEMQIRQEAASRLFPKGAQIEHTKTGGVYRILAHGISEATLQAGFLYENIEHSSEVAFWRPVSQLLDQVVVRDEVHPRFRRVD